MMTICRPIKLTPSIKTLLLALLLPLSMLFTSPAFALNKINTTFFGNLAVEGYDTVAYFTENRPIAGKKQYQMEWMGANWRFSSAENLALFKADPNKYAPQYGGFCAYAVSQNSSASIEPEQFTIYDEKLYLNYNSSINKKWRKDKESYIIDADNYWPQLIAK